MGRSNSDVKLREINYQPLPSQKIFHELDTRFKGFSGPIGSGKSQALCHEAIRLTYQNPGRLGLLGAPTFPMLRDATQVALLEILDANNLPYDVNKAENTLIMKDTRSRILFRSVEEFERLRGTNLAWFGLDELTYAQEESWLRLEGRLRDPLATKLCGFAVWTPKGYDWVYRKFIVREIEGYGVVRAQAFENKHLLGKVNDYYSQLEKSYDAKFYEQEVLGLYLSMDGGRVYCAFDRNEHVADVRVDPNLPLLWAMDFNVDPMSSVIVQIDNGHVRVLDEIVLRHATTRDACEAFLSRYSSHRSVLVYGDSSGNHSQTTGFSDYEMVKDTFRALSDAHLEYVIPKKNPAVKDRINLTNRTLKTAAGEVGLTVDPKCKELIQDFEEVCYKSDTNQIDKERDRNRTHVSDALGYLLWEEFRPGKPGLRKDKRIV